MFEINKRAKNSVVQIINIGGAEIAEFAVLAPTPHPLVGVGLGVIGRKFLLYDVGMPGQPCLDYLGLFMDASTVPDDSPLSWQLLRQVLQEFHYLLAMHIRILPPSEVQSHTLPLWTERHATDYRNSIVGCRARHDHTFAPWGQGSSYQWLKQEARFVQESNVRSTTPGLAEDAWQLVGLPAFTLLVVALPGTPLRLVTGPVQTTSEYLANVFWVILDTKVDTTRSSPPYLVHNHLSTSTLRSIIQAAFV